MASTDIKSVSGILPLSTVQTCMSYDVQLVKRW